MSPKKTQKKPNQNQRSIEKVEPKQIKDNKTAKVEPEQPEKLENESKQVDDGDLLDAPETGPPPKPFSMGLGIGSATLDGVLYNQVSLRPEINIGKIGIGLDLVVYSGQRG